MAVSVISQSYHLDTIIITNSHVDTSNLNQFYVRLHYVIFN